MFYVLNFGDHTFKSFDNECQLYIFSKTLTEEDKDNMEVINGFVDDVRYGVDEYLSTCDMQTEVERWRDAAEALGWKVDETVQNDKVCIDFSRYSPAGEDFSFAVYPSNLRCPDVAYAIRDYGFDVEEHVAMWLDAKSRSYPGVPDVETLVDDAKAIRFMIDELEAAIRNA